MRWTTALASCSTLAVCGLDDAYAATGTSVGSAARAIARMRPRSVTMPTNRWPSTTASAPSCAWSIRWAATSRLSWTSTVNSPGLQASSTFMSLSLGGDPPSYAAWRSTGRLGGCCAVSGARMGSRTDSGRICSVAQPWPSCARARTSEEQGVVRSQQRPAPWASAGDLGAFDRLAQQQIAPAVVTDGHDPHGLGCLLCWFGRPAAACGVKRRPCRGRCRLRCGRWVPAPWLLAGPGAEATGVAGSPVAGSTRWLGSG
jgi:hypothetical protein